MSTPACVPFVVDPQSTLARPRCPRSFSSISSNHAIHAAFFRCRGAVRSREAQGRPHWPGIHRYEGPCRRGSRESSHGQGEYEDAGVAVCRTISRRERRETSYSRVVTCRTPRTTKVQTDRDLAASPTESQAPAPSTPSPPRYPP
jgi:hypothetical protein